MTGEKTYSIKEAAELTGLSAGQLRWLDSHLKIKANRQQHGKRSYRVYSEDDIKRIREVTELRSVTKSNMLHAVKLNYYQAADDLLEKIRQDHGWGEMKSFKAKIGFPCPQCGGSVKPAAFEFDGHKRMVIIYAEFE